jgi:hypothetical protein
MAEGSSNGPVLDPLRVLRVFSEDQYEDMIGDWQRGYLQTKYARVENIGGPTDKGRDVICTDYQGASHFYQCKHYDRKLAKNDIFPEIGKCCYYSFTKKYPVPKKYYFVSPQGVTPDVRDLFAAPEILKQEIIDQWSKKCQSKITSNPVLLEGDFLSFVTQFDFSIYNYVAPEEFLADFKTTPYYTKWFGKISKPRKLISAAPDIISPNESTYIRKILDAYSDYLGKHIDDEKRLKETDPELWNDFNRQRLYFYSAEYLAAYSRDIYAPEFEWFEQLKQEFYHGIIDEIQQDAINGFERLRKVLSRAVLINTSSSNPLTSEAKTLDKKGICHHLANERDEIKWTK